MKRRVNKSRRNADIFTTKFSVNSVQRRIVVVKCDFKHVVPFKRDEMKFHLLLVNKANTFKQLFK